MFVQIKVGSLLISSPLGNSPKADFLIRKESLVLFGVVFFLKLRA